ncbi:MAG: phenylacetate--CoA ligase family protein [Deltaproteobacteria bacterium]|nr:phenylacetate--CoA ligase family protein [Deltaproteobacteria bacterium]
MSMKINFWNEPVETMSRDELRELQWQRLRKQMRYIYYNSAHYRQIFMDMGAHPDDVKNLEEFRNLPIFLEKERDRLSQEKTRNEQGHTLGEYLCCSPRDLRAIHTTSGTTGLPVFESFTQHDIEVQNEVMARSFWRMGWRPGDSVIHGVGLSMWIAGMVTLRAFQNFGLLGIPAGAESGTERFLQFAKLTMPDHMSSFPSFVEHMIDAAPKTIGCEVRDLGLKTIMCGGEPGAGDPKTRKKIEDAYGAKLFDITGGNWGLWAVSCDTPTYQGMHLMGEDYVLVDVVDPDTKKPVDTNVPVARGEMVVTCLEWKANPAFRYAHGDIIELMNEPCICGRPGMRMRYVGRVDDLLIVKGVNVFPRAIKSVVDTFVPRVTSEMRIILETEPPMVKPPLKMKVEYGPEVTDTELESLKTEIENAIATKLRVHPKIELVPPNSIEKDPTKKATLVEKRY